MLSFTAQCLAGALIVLVQLASVAVAGVVLAALKLLELAKLFQLPHPAARVGAQNTATVLVLERHAEASPFMPQVDADRLRHCVESWSHASAQPCTLMLADHALKQEFQATVTTPADLLFFKIFYNYPCPEQFHYHALIVLDAPCDSPASRDLMARLNALGDFSLSHYPATPAVNIPADHARAPSLTTLFIGQSTLWSRSAAQYLFDLEIRHLLNPFNRMQERITYWVGEGAPRGKNGLSPLWFSHESHGSLRQMLFAQWKTRQRFTDLMFLNLAGLTTVMYSGLNANDVLARDPTRLSECIALFGRLLGLVLYGYKKLFGHWAGASNQAVLFRVLKITPSP